jgi:hypothetical protein
MRWLLLLILLPLTLGLTACSYSTDFVVLNDTDYPVEVVYRMKPTPGPLALPGDPKVVPAANLEMKDSNKWTPLAPDRFRIVEANRTVSVRLLAHEALWVTAMHHYIGDEDPNDVEGFPIEELSVKGADGEMRFSGDKARKAFERKSRVLYVLSYQ